MRTTFLKDSVFVKYRTMKKQKYTVRITFPHLKGWEKNVEVEAVDKHKAIIAAEKAYPQGKAVGFINESRTKDRTPMDDMKDCINNALVSNVNPIEKRMDFDKRYTKRLSSDDKERLKKYLED